MTESQIDPTVPPSGTGCVECEETGSWWVHLRRCAVCGHIGCCDSSLNKHATAHFHSSGHRYVQSFEPGEDWFWDYLTEETFTGPPLAPPTSRPDDQPSPGPRGRVPARWRELLAAGGAAG
ncbi:MULTISPECIES: UBP-type zinc finger domain-containing protein [unclassified Microbacterium]|uniref:UBP-type zinc finger domain-containing protein n=1 Tax=unclassified Microbacterium TaxID=2609290 RepID=UPI00214B6398|nr:MULTISPECIES: UBP-type zinc finger domain-containing protein [unclassified Microbacterium]MCR2784080.1 UBP-type zinc finger domain-containing protein [Microbacterium sp. zg.B96]WIM15080.1 UBP-type zinc finger domain-containing protein [Microbacterium sp. zg-B96]